jgi:hypothetical protein
VADGLGVEDSQSVQDNVPGWVMTTGPVIVSSKRPEAIERETGHEPEYQMMSWERAQSPYVSSGNLEAISRVRLLTGMRAVALVAIAVVAISAGLSSSVAGASSGSRS